MYIICRMFFCPSRVGKDSAFMGIDGRRGWILGRSLEPVDRIVGR
jgi:hypothetical protein